MAAGGHFDRPVMRVLLVLCAVLGLSACRPTQTSPGAEAPVYIQTRFTDMPGWSADRHAESIPALLVTCDRLAQMPEGTRLGEGDSPVMRAAGTAGQWRDLCAAAKALPAGNHAAARAFYEQYFTPIRLTAGTQQTGLLTGYFEPELRGARRQSAAYPFPLYRRPANLQAAAPGTLTDEAGRALSAGRVDRNGRLTPYPTRREIEDGALRGQNLELLYVSSAPEAFMLQIQGSGRVRLDDGSVVRVGYAGSNGRPYVAIGRMLIERGEIPRAEISMQTIRAWLERHPEQGRALMLENPTFIFFREMSDLAENLGALGALGVPLTPGRSLAVDKGYMPLGVPVFVATTDPIDGAPWQRVLQAQDTGSAIRGVVRGDIFYGWGNDAATRAGRMRNQGSITVLVPRAG